MTVGVGYRVPGHGAVLCVDGRLSSPDTGEIFSDRAVKWCSSGSILALYAGELGWAWHAVQSAPPRTWAELDSRAQGWRDAKLDFELLAYDRKAERLMHSEHGMSGSYAAIGSGGSVALGVLDASRPARDLESATKLCRLAVEIACKRNVFCGGKITALVAEGRRAPIRVL